MSETKTAEEERLMKLLLAARASLNALSIQIDRFPGARLTGFVEIAQKGLRESNPYVAGKEEA